MSSVNPSTPSSPSCRTRARTLSYRPARACFCRSPTASKQLRTTMERSLPLTSRSQRHWGRYPILPNPITRGNAASTNTPTACSDSTSQKVQISLLCPIPMSKGSRINSTLAPERYSATELLVRFSSTPRLAPLHFAVEWAHGYDHAGSGTPTFAVGHLVECNPSSAPGILAPAHLHVVRHRRGRSDGAGGIARRHQHRARL